MATDAELGPSTVVGVYTSSRFRGVLNLRAAGIVYGDLPERGECKDDGVKMPRASADASAGFVLCSSECKARRRGSAGVQQPGHLESDGRQDRLAGWGHSFDTKGSSLWSILSWSRSDRPYRAGPGILHTDCYPRLLSLAKVANTTTTARVTVSQERSPESCGSHGRLRRGLQLFQSKCRRCFDFSALYARSGVKWRRRQRCPPYEGSGVVVASAGEAD